jgi:hypothetical protein
VVVVIALVLTPLADKVQLLPHDQCMLDDLNVCINTDWDAATTDCTSNVHCFVGLHASALRCHCFKCVDTAGRNTQRLDRQFLPWHTAVNTTPRKTSICHTLSNELDWTKDTYAGGKVGPTGEDPRLFRDAASSGVSGRSLHLTISFSSVYALRPYKGRQLTCSISSELASSCSPFSQPTIAHYTL